jgi:hypothetical protein
MLIIEEAIVAMKCRTAIKALFFYFKCNVGQSLMLIYIHILFFFILIQQFYNSNMSIYTNILLLEAREHTLGN